MIYQVKINKLRQKTLSYHRSRKIFQKRKKKQYIFQRKMGQTATATILKNEITVNIGYQSILMVYLVKML